MATKKTTRKKVAKKKKKVVKRKTKRDCYTSNSARERDYQRLTEFYGRSFVEDIFSGLHAYKDRDPVMRLWMDKLDHELDEQGKKADEYFKKLQIDLFKISRPKKCMRRDEIEYLCSIGCTLEEVAGFFKMQKSEFQNKVKHEFGISFTEFQQMALPNLKISLRRAQINNALEGDTQMQKFLGKNVLGQKDKVEFDGSVKANTWVELVKNIEDEEKSDE